MKHGEAVTFTQSLTTGEVEDENVPRGGKSMCWLPEMGKLTRLRV